MSDYTPGSGYDKGYSARMGGGQLPVQASNGASDPYWQEYATGWRDADNKIIREARQRHDNLNESNVSKTFIQD